MMKLTLSLRQWLTFTHMLLAVLLVGSYSLQRFDSEGRQEVDTQVKIAKALLKSEIREFSLSASGSNYTAVSTSEALTRYQNTDNLLFFHVDATSDLGSPYQVSWSREVDALWKTNTQPAYWLEQQQQLKKMKQLGDLATEENQFKYNYLIQRQEEKVERLRLDLERIKQFKQSYILPEGIEVGSYQIDKKKALLHLLIPLPHVEGTLWAVFSISDLLKRQHQVAITVIVQALFAIVFSAILIWWLIRWIVRPIASLTESMTKEVEQIDIANIPEKNRKDELGLLANRYIQLVNRIQSQILGLKQQTMIDTLTGVYSRFAFEKRVPAKFSTYQKSKRLFGLMLIDIDNFKQYNDKFGHTAGDVALRETANMLASILENSGGEVYRYGGEEFVVVVKAKNHQQIADIAEQLRSGVEQMKAKDIYNELKSVVTISIGVLILGKGTPAYPFADCFEQVDNAMYQAKTQGRNRVVIQSKVQAA